MRHAVRRLLLGVLALALVAGGLGAASTGAQATGFRPGPVGSDDFHASSRYRGDFPDPMVVRVGSRYYGYSTTIANQNLPIIYSDDLISWYALPTREGGGHPDGLWKAAKWSNSRWIGDRKVAPTWAPSVAYMGSHWVHVYATQLRNKSRFCISLSRSTSATGVFVDSSDRALVCPGDEGAIDPHLWRGPDGRYYLLWKTEGVPGRKPTRLWIQRLNGSATGFYPGTAPTELLRTAPDSWEGNVIENPAMYKIGSRYYLFYSGNSWSSARYAIGYAICETVYGPCTRPRATPLLATNRYVAGPGGAMLFRDTRGNVRMAYHAWTPGHVGYPKTDSCRASSAGCPQRRLHIGRIAVSAKGLLRVSELNARP